MKRSGHLLYDLEELNPLITNLPPQVQADYLQRFGDSIIRPYKREVLAQLDAQPQATPLPALSERTTSPYGLKLLQAQAHISRHNTNPSLDAAVYFQAQADNLRCVTQQDAQLKAQAEDGTACARASAQAFFLKSAQAVALLWTVCVLCLFIGLGLALTSYDPSELNEAVHARLTALSAYHDQPSSGLGPQAVSTSIWADAPLSDSLLTMVLKGSELLAQESALQDLGGTPQQVMPRTDPELEAYERVLLQQGVVPPEADSAAIARYYLPETLQGVDYYQLQPTYQPARVLQPNYQELSALRLRDSHAPAEPNERPLVPILSDEVAPLTTR